VSSIHFVKRELAEAFARGVCQCVVIASRPHLREAITSSTDETVKVFAIDEKLPSLAEALEESDFDKQKASFFVWLGDARYRTIDAAISSLAFIASLPIGSGVLLDYAALDALASRLCFAGGAVMHLIQPQAVAALLRGLGFQKIVDLAQEDWQASGGHLVSAVV
jgi:O-methyltransferase involved in polyketide biosynthesis